MRDERLLQIQKTINKEKANVKELNKKLFDYPLYRNDSDIQNKISILKNQESEVMMVKCDSSILRRISKGLLI